MDRLEKIKMLLAITEQNNKMINNLIMELDNDLDDDYNIDDNDADDDDDVEGLLMILNVKIPRRYWMAVSKNILYK